MAIHKNHLLFNKNNEQKFGLFLREAAKNTPKYLIDPFLAVRGVWIQAFVQDFHAEVSGFIRLILKDTMGNQLFPPTNKMGIFLIDTFHSEWKSVKLRWGFES